MKKHLLTGILAGPATFVMVITIGIPTHTFKTNLPNIHTVQIPGASAPSVCISANQAKNSWSMQYQECPAGYAVYSVDDPGGKSRDGSKLAINVTCCPLPSDDILTSEHVDASDGCPENYVATGMRALECKDWENCTKNMRCTKINTERYQLGEMKTSLYWGNGFAGWQGSDRIEWSDIPPALRYSAGRVAENNWDVDGCVGFPWGSLFAKKTSKYCGGIYFRQLQFKGRLGDPQKGTAVKMIPDCDDVANINDPLNVKCVKNG